jgi:sirohydrochlorin ferrochelatase
MLIALAHGSRKRDWRRSLEDRFELVQAELGADKLQLAYMDYSPPSLMDVVEAAVQHGATRFRVLPLFLTIEGHVTKDILPMLEGVRQAFASVEIELLPPLGQQPMFLEMLRLLATDDAP